MRSTNLTVDIVKNLSKIFEDKKWINSFDKDEDVFNDFCDMLKNYEYDEQKFIIGLTERYLWINENQYYLEFKKVYTKLITNLKDRHDIERLVFLPLIAPEDKNKNKSSNFLYYLFKSHLERLKPIVSSIRIELCDNSDNIISFKITNKDKIVLIDDFVGTGNTAMKAIEYLETLGIERTSIIILTLVIQNNGLTRLKGNSLEVFSGYERGKGISDFPLNREINIKFMEKLEEKTGVSSEYLFGYERSEALVTMARTPNNTFPIYWQNKKGKIKVPFPR